MSPAIFSKNSTRITIHISDFAIVTLSLILRKKNKVAELSIF